MSILLPIAAGVQMALGIGQTIAANQRAKKFEQQSRGTLDEMKGLKYSDYTEGYRNDLANQAQYGLRDSERGYMEGSVDRAFGASNRVAENRRAGLLGLAGTTTRLSDQYRQIGVLDTQRRIEKEREYMLEKKNQAEQTLSEDRANLERELAMSRASGQEANSLANTGLQNAFGGLTNLGLYGIRGTGNTGEYIPNPNVGENWTTGQTLGSNSIYNQNPVNFTPLQINTPNVAGASLYNKNYINPLR